MAVLACESWDLWGFSGWSFSSSNGGSLINGGPFVQGARNGNGLRMAYYGGFFESGLMTKTVNMNVTGRRYTVGFAVFIQAGANNSLAGFNGTTVFYSPTGAIQWNGITSPLTFGGWVYIECQFWVGVAGTAILRVNGNHQGQATVNNSAGTSLTMGRFSGTGTQWDYIWDDIYVLDNVGPVNDFLSEPGPNVHTNGPSIRMLSPDADGAHTAWTPNTGTRWQAVDDAYNSPDDDTTYIEGVAGQKNTVSVPDPGATAGEISYVRLVTRAKKAGSAEIQARRIIRSEGTDHVSAALPIGSAYSDVIEDLPLHPDGSVWGSRERFSNVEVGTEAF